MPCSSCPFDSECTVYTQTGDRSHAFNATPRIHLLLFYFDSMRCSGLVHKVTGYGLYSQGLVLSRSREFLLCQQTDWLPLGPTMGCNWSWTWIWCQDQMCTGFYHRGQCTLSLLGTLTTFTFYSDVTGGAYGGIYWKCLILCFVCSQLVGRKWVHHGQQTRSNVMSKWSAIWCTETR
jgi:drug/metabolite transporter superfamily protein YnfA